MHSFGRKRKHTKDFWHNGFMLKGYAQCVICMKQQQNEGMSRTQENT